MNNYDENKNKNNINNNIKYIELLEIKYSVITN